MSREESADIARKGTLHGDFDTIARGSASRKPEGSINGGGPKLFIKTYRGKIRLKRWGCGDRGALEEGRREKAID